MIFLVIFGGLILLLGSFYLANSWIEYHEWKTGTVIVILSLIATVYGAINLPGEIKQHKEQQRTEQTVTQPTQNGKIDNKFADVQNQQNQPTQEQKENYVLRQLQKSYSKLGSVGFDSKTKTYQITPTDDNTKKAVQALVQDPSVAKQIGWSNLTDSLDNGSKQVSKVLKGDYSMSLLNPDKPSQVLYSTKNGQTTYNIAK